MKQVYLLLIALFSCIGVNAIALKATTAQVTPDGTTKTTVNTEGDNITINDGDRAGNNLFHSFQDFSVPNGGSAVFNNDVAIENIFSRITGGNISNIDGLLGANGSANLFLINPAGIILGEGARLDIGGSFYGSTADSILFEEGEFSATDLENSPLITINAPIGLNFRDNPGDIVNRSSTTNDGGLLVNEGESISLIGGNVNFEDAGEILASGARVNLGGLIETGTINITENGNLSFPNNVARGDVSLADSSRIFVASDGGGSVRIDAKNFELASGSLIIGGIASDVATLEAQAGDIVINTTRDVVVDGAGGESITTIVNNNLGVGNAGNIEINARNIFSVNGGAITSSSNGLGNAGNITLTAAENISLKGIFLSQIGGVQNSVLVLQASDTEIAEQTGVPGTTNLTAKNLTVANGAQITSFNSGVGDSGNININAVDSINVNGEAELIRADGTAIPLSSKISTSVFGAGNGNVGDVSVFTNNLFLNNGGAISTDSFGVGNAGDINITAKTINIDGQGTTTELVDDSGQVSRLASTSNISSEVISTGESTLIEDGIVAEGNGGTITIYTDSLSISNGGDISTSISGVGNAGDIEITAKTIDIDGQGFVELVNDSGQISPLGIISSISSEVISNPDGTAISQGDGGNIKINTNSLSLTDGGSVEADISGVGDGGNITINAQNNIFIQGTGISTINDETVNLPSEISALLSTDSRGNSGGVEVNTAKLSVIDGGRISVSTLGEGNAGNLSIDATDSIELFSNSSIVSNVTPNAVGKSGAVNIKTGDLTISDNSQIQSASIGTGEAGNIRIDANSINLNEVANIAATTRTGDGGNITLKVAENITLQNNNNFISARALNDANGGNVNIDADFIFAFPNQNNDIIATAEQGNGGNIKINAQALFGLAKRETLAEDFTNDIDASSQFGFTGAVSITTPDLNPIQGATELPSNVVEPQQTTAQACAAGRNTGVENSLLVGGRGGISPSPELPLNSETIVIQQELANPVNQKLQSETDSTSTSSLSIKPIFTATGKIFPARGIELSEDGDVILTAYQTKNTTRTSDVLNNCVSQSNF